MAAAASFVVVVAVGGLSAGPAVADFSNYCQPGWQPGAACQLAPPTPDNPSHGQIRFSKTVGNVTLAPGEQVVISFTNSGCPVSSTPIDVWAVFGLNAKGQQPSTHVGQIEATAPSQTSRISFAVPTGPDPPGGVAHFSMSFSAPGTTSCFPPGYSGTWVLGASSCSGTSARLSSEMPAAWRWAGGAQLGAAAASGGDCKLDVKVTGKRSLTAGLAFDGLEPTFLEGDKCLSGCTDLLVTVTDPGNHHKAVAGANVSASMQPIGDKYLKRDSTGYLCNAAKPTHCGTGRFISGLKTDKHGHLRLLYWAPGLLTKQSTTLTVKASKRCSASACSLGEKLGEANPKIIVSPNLIYHAPATVSLLEARALADWTQGALLKFAGLKAIDALFDKSLNVLVKAERLAETLGKAGERIIGVLEFAHFVHDVKEQYGFMALFLEAFHFSAIGIGLAPDAHRVTAVPSDAFVRAFAGDGLPPLHLGLKGLLWRYGENLALVDQRHELTARQFLHLYVYEVSDCKQGADCGPGYFGQHGIRPKLYVEFVSRTSTFQGSYLDSFVLRYNARAWMSTQHGIKVR